MDIFTDRDIVEHLEPQPIDIVKYVDSLLNALSCLYISHLAKHDEHLPHW